VAVVVDAAVAAERVQALAVVAALVKLRAAQVVDVAVAAERVQALAVVAALVVAGAAARRLHLCRRLVRRDVEASWWPGTPSLKKRRGVARPDPVPGLMPAVLSRPRETWCLQMSLTACLHSKRIRVSRFWTSQPE